MNLIILRGVALALIKNIIKKSHLKNSFGFLKIRLNLRQRLLKNEKTHFLIVTICVNINSKNCTRNLLNIHKMLVGFL